ncbi:Zn-ribbon domain-containing OB-fold protein [Pseudonocardia xishanensis]|uniref:ChsH2 rubredoxin-like zinc ribbon domain-containing protein n=1 Tax=Pseudonocardia xishanensis TaxID=630995 RepID=A0ABP8RYN6_9PSEU
MNETTAEVTVLGLCDAEKGTAGMAAQYGEILAGGRAVLQGCARCGAAAFPPRLRCRSCSSDDLQWWDAGDTAKVTSWARVALNGPTETASVPRRVGKDGPYTTVVVQPESFADVRLLCLLVTADGGIEHDAVPTSNDRVTVRTASLGGSMVPVCSLGPNEDPR